MEVIRGRKIKPISVLLVGTQGVGKTSWAEKAPSPISIGADERDEITGDRLPNPKTWDEFLDQVRWIKDKSTAYKTIIIDTLDSIERLLHKKILATDPKQTGVMQTAHGGYGKAFEKAEADMAVLRDLLKACRDEKGMHIIIIAHSKKVNVEDGRLGIKYAGIELNLHMRVQNLFGDWVSAILFADYDRTKKEDENNSDRVFVVGSGERMLYTERRPFHPGKNRYNLPYELPLDFDEFYSRYLDFYAGKKRSVDEVIASITGKLTNLDGDTAKKVVMSVEKAMGNMEQLEKIDERVNSLIKS